MSRADRTWLLTTILLVAALVVGGIILLLDHATHPVEQLTLSHATPQSTIGQVSIDGAVANPGVYDVTEGDTLESLLAAAGLVPGADLNNVRLEVPKHNEAQVPQRIDINRADPWLLQALPGIGATRAQAIVDYRNANGHFRRIEGLLNVKGIGEGTFDRLKSFVSISE